MKVRMSEHYQDSTCHLYPDKEYEVDGSLGEFLLKHRKAVKVEPAPTFKHLDVEPQFEQAEPPPQPQEFRNRRGGRRAS